MRACPHCGTTNDDENVYCNNCGASLPQLTQHVIQQVGGEATKQGGAAAGKDAGARPSAAPEGSQPPEGMKKPKHRTMVGLGMVPSTPPMPGPVKMMQEGIKTSRHETLIGMHVDADETPIEEPAQKKAPAQAEAKPEPMIITPIIIKGAQAAPPKESPAAGSEIKGEKKSATGAKSFTEDAEIEILIEPTLHSEEELPEKEAWLPRARPAAQEEAGPLIEEEEREPEPEKTAAAPRAMPAAGEKEKSRSGYFVAAFLLLVAVIGGYYYYQQVSTKNEPPEEAQGNEVAPAETPEQPPPQGVPAKFKVTLQGLPVSSSVSVDDVLHPERPVVLQQAQGPRKFKIEATGYEPWEKAVAVESDVTFPVDMKPLHAAPPSVGKPAVKKPPLKAPAKEPAKKKVKHKKKSQPGPDDNPYG